MKNLILSIAAITLFLMGCESQKFELIATVNTTKTYTVDNSGIFNESAEVEVHEILAELDLPEDAIIGDVNVEGVAVKVEPLADNEADAVDVTGNVFINGGMITLFDNFKVTSTDGSWVSITGLGESAVAAVKERLAQYVLGTNTSSFTLWTSGYSSPTAGSRVHADVTIQISGTVKYYQEADVPWFIHGVE